MTKLPLFDQLVMSEAAIRLESAHRRQFVTLSEDKGPVVHRVDNPDKGDTREEVAKNLYETFLHLYDFTFEDSSQYHKVQGNRVFNSRDLDKAGKERIKGLFAEFAERLYEADGSLKSSLRDTPQEAPFVMQHLYERLRDESPLQNSQLASGALFVELGRGEKWKSLYPRGVDFTRGEPTDDLAKRFSDAFQAPDHAPQSSEYWKLPESQTEVAGARFHSKRDVDGWRTHLVTQTGHLVDLTDERKAEIHEHLSSGKPLGELKVDVNKANHLRDFQDEVGSAHAARRHVHQKLAALAKADSIDGAPVKDESGRYLPARLMSSDLDLLTGLRITPAGGEKASELGLFKEFLGCGFADLVPESFTKNILAMPDEKSREQARGTLSVHVREEMVALQKKAIARGDTALADIVSRAGANLEVMIPRIYEIADKAFLKDGDGKFRKTPATATPHLYLTMGGSASGKSGLKAIASQECKNSLVVASLDDARGESDRYWLYPATNNHNDDYKATEQFAGAIRDLVTRRALKGKYDLYIDGSGIPYDGRNDKITRAFKNEGYNVMVLAAQAPLFVHDPKRRQELFEQGSAPSDAFLRMGSRLQNELRGLIPEIVAEKHIGFPLASRNAARDPNVDRFVMMDSTPSTDKVYTLSYVLTLEQAQLDKLVNLDGDALKQALLADREKLVPRWVTLPKDNGQEHLYNLKVVRNNGNGSYRVEIITDIEQYIGMVQKGLLRRDAKGPEALYDNRMHGDVEGYFQGPGGKLNIQDAKWVVTSRFPERYKPLSAAQGCASGGIG